MLQGNKYLFHKHVREMNSVFTAVSRNGDYYSPRFRFPSSLQCPSFATYPPAKTRTKHQNNQEKN
jgi:hypothetical protein